MRRRGVVLICAALVGFAACTGGDDDPTSTLQPTSTVATPSATPCAVEGATTEDREREGGDFGPVIDVRQTAEGCARIVFEFKDAVSGYDIGYADAPFSECGSGADVDTSQWDAAAFLRVRLEPSGGPDIESESGEPYYKGSRDIAIDGDVLKHMKVICDFEAVFEWLIGLDEKRPFEVTTFEDPLRLVIDISES